VFVLWLSVSSKHESRLTNYLIDKALAIDSLLFMISALLSFLSIRLNESTEVWSVGGNDLLAGLVSMTLITVNFLF